MVQGSSHLITHQPILKTRRITIAQFWHFTFIPCQYIRCIYAVNSLVGFVEEPNFYYAGFVLLVVLPHLRYCCQIYLEIRLRFHLCPVCLAVFWEWDECIPATTLCPIRQRDPLVTVPTTCRLHPKGKG